MAAAIAKKRLGEGAKVASAGVGAVGGPAAQEAILVMKLVYKIDISDHEAVNLSDFNPSDFDYIIAMDFLVYTQLKTHWSVPENKLYGWDIEDPLGLGYDAFKETALKIERRLDQFLAGHGLD